MTYNSLAFLIFLPAATLIFWVLPHKFRWIFLLLASLFVYMFEDPWFIVPIAISSVVSYIGAILIDRTQNKKAKKTFMIITVCLCLSILIFYKYITFFLNSIFDVYNFFTGESKSTSFSIILPVGISFYTFQALAYVLDVYRGEFKAEKHFGYYALFVTYFAQLVAGPIDRPDLIPQLRANNKFDKKDFMVGFRLLLCGYFRKCVVADICGVFVNSVFADLAAANALAILIAGLLFAIQVYSDFLGYSEIASGAARMMGIRLIRNFDRPFMATSVRDFMSRWHISLTTWFRDYVYIPLGGNKKGKLRQCFNILFVYFLSGLWHGANWTFVLWGLYIGIFIVIETLIRPHVKRFCSKHNINIQTTFALLVRRFLVILFFIPAALIFRSASVWQIGEVFTIIFTQMGFGSAYLSAALTSLSMTYMDIVQVVLSITALALVYHMGEYGRDKPVKSRILTNPQAKLLDNAEYSRRVLSVVYIIFAIAIAWFMLLASNSSSSFVYFQF